MISKELIILLSVFFALRCKTFPRKWFFFSLFWSLVFVVYILVALIVNLAGVRYRLTTELFALAIMPLFVLIFSYEKNLTLVIKIIKYMFILNTLVIVFEIVSGNILYRVGMLDLTSHFNILLRSPDGYPSWRQIRGFVFFRPVGAFQNTHISSLMLVLQYAVFSIEDNCGMHTEKKYKKYIQILRIAFAAVIFFTNNMQAILSFIIFYFFYYMPKVSIRKMLGLVLGGFTLMIPMALSYMVGKGRGDNILFFIKLLIAQFIYIDNWILFLGLQIHPLNLNNKAFLVSKGIVPSGLVFDIGPYLMLTRYGVVGVALIILYALTMITGSHKQARYPLFCLFLAAATTFIHYPVVFSASGLFVLMAISLHINSVIARKQSLVVEAR